jgi:hypothetical protein
MAEAVPRGVPGLDKPWTEDRTQTLNIILGLVSQLARAGWADSATKGRVHAALVEELEDLNRAVWRLMDEQRRRKYYAARFCYRHRNEMTPGTRPGHGPVPWPTWFREIFGDELDWYMRQCQERDTLKTVYEYEIARFGKSALEEDMKRREAKAAAA